MLLKFGKESVNIQWKHVITYLASLIIYVIGWAIIVSGLATILSSLNRMDFFFYFYSLATQLPETISWLIVGLIAYIIYKLYKNFSQKDWLSIAVFSLIFYLVFFGISSVIVYYIVFGTIELIDNFLVRVPSFLFSAAFFYLALIFVYKNVSKLMKWEVIGLAFGLALLDPLLVMLMGYIENMQFILPSLDLTLFLGILNRAFFAYVVMAYIVLRKGKLHNAIIAVAVLFILTEIGRSVQYGMGIGSWLYSIVFFSLIYAAGYWLVKK